MLAALMYREWEIMEDLSEFNLELAEEEDSGVILFTMNAQPALVGKVIEVKWKMKRLGSFLIVSSVRQDWKGGK